MPTDDQIDAINASMTMSLFLAQTTEIVSAFVANNAVQAADLPKLVVSVYDAIVDATERSKPKAEPVKLEPPVPIRKTVTPDHIISLEDGKPYKSLRRHLSSRGISPEEYRRKWGLPHDYPMVSEVYSAARSELAKSIGLGQIRRDRKLKAVA